MSLMTVDLVVVETGESLIGFVDRSDPPDFGVPFRYEHEGRSLEVRRVPSVIQPAIVKNYGTRALSRPKWHPAFEKHDSRGFGIVEDKRDLQRVLDNQKARAKSEEDIWTWDQE